MNQTVEQEQTRRETLEQLDEWLDVPMLVLSVIWLGLVLYELGYGSNALVEPLSVAIWVVFIAEFILRFTLAPHKREFLKTNWLTVIALLAPALRLLRIFRIFRAARRCGACGWCGSSARPTAAWGRSSRRCTDGASVMSRR